MYQYSLWTEIDIALFWAHFDDRYWVMLPLAKKYVFPNIKEKIPKSRNKQKTSPFCDILTNQPQTALRQSKSYFSFQMLKCAY